MNYLEKYLKYKTKYLNYKKNHELIGGVYMNPKYKTFINYRDTIRRYFNENKEQRIIFEELAKRLATGFEPCKTSCWSLFMKHLNLTEYLASFNTDHFFLYPYQRENDVNFSTEDYNIPNNNIIKYNTNTNFISLMFKDVLMLDYDIKDDIPDPEHWTPEVKSIHLRQVISKIQNVVNYFMEKFNITLHFILFHTDRGYHFFLLNKTGSNKNLFLIELMKTVCNDQWYSAFCYSNGFAIRLNPKKVGDFTAELSFNDNFIQAFKNNTILPEDKFETIRSTNQITFYSRIYETFINFKYPKITDPSLFFIKPTVLFQDDSNPNPLQNIVSQEDHTDYIFNKLCYQYILIRYFRNFNEDKLMKLNCSVGNTILGGNSVFLENLREDLSYIAEYFLLTMDESIKFPLSFQNMPQQLPQQPAPQPPRYQFRQPVQQPVQQPAPQPPRYQFRQPVQQPVQQSPPQSPRNQFRQPVQQSAPQPAPQPARNQFRQPAPQPASQSAQQSPRNQFRQPAQNQP